MVIRRKINESEKLVAFEG